MIYFKTANEAARSIAKSKKATCSCETKIVPVDTFTQGQLFAIALYSIKGNFLGYY